jgi:D-alanyl-D-alanine dipeptidase
LGGLALLPLWGCSPPAPQPRRTAPIEGAAPGTAHDLVELIKLDPAFKLDIRYATPNNFTGRVLYPQVRAFLRKEAAQALLAALIELKAAGYGLLIYDGYRPFRITQLMWDVTPRAKRNYVANPKDGSRHNRGCAVDLTLYELKTGQPLLMPSGYDEFSPRAHHDFMGAPPEAIANRTLLRETMQAHGFYAMSNEWWHYDFMDWKQYPLLDVGFEDL